MPNISGRVYRTLKSYPMRKKPGNEGQRWEENFIVYPCEPYEL